MSKDIVTTAQVGSDWEASTTVPAAISGGDMTEIGTGGCETAALADLDNNLSGHADSPEVQAARAEIAAKLG